MYTFTEIAKMVAMTEEEVVDTFYAIDDRGDYYTDDEIAFSGLMDETLWSEMENVFANNWHASNEEFANMKMWHFNSSITLGDVAQYLCTQIPSSQVSSEEHAICIVKDAIDLVRNQGFKDFNTAAEFIINPSVELLINAYIS